MPDFSLQQQQLADLLITLTIGAGGDPTAAIDLWRSLAQALQTCGLTTPAGLRFGLSQDAIEAGLCTALIATAERAKRREWGMGKPSAPRTETERRKTFLRRVSWAAHDLRLSYPDEWAAALL